LDTNKTKYPWGFDVVLKLNMSQTCFGVWDMTLASNGKLTSDEHKKCLETSLCLYCGAGDHKLDSYPKKQTMVSPKGHGASATADTLTAASEKPSEK